MARRAYPHATYADLEALPEHVVGEIVFGMLHASPRPRPMHARVATRVGMRLGSFDHDGSEVHSLHGSSYTLSHTLRGDQAHAIPPFESLPLVLADLWAR